MNKENCVYYKWDSFKNTDSVGGIIRAREILNELKATNKRFLAKHPEYEEGYGFVVKELTTDMEYYIFDKNLHGSKENK